MVGHLAGWRREHQVVAAEERRRIVEHLEGPGRERHAVLARRPFIDLRPAGAAHLGGARRSEDEELEGQHRAGVAPGLAHALERAADSRMRQRPLVLRLRWSVTPRNWYNK